MYDLSEYQSGAFGMAREIGIGQFRSSPALSETLAAFGLACMVRR
jgi:hypothetical protein